MLEGVKQDLIAKIVVLLFILLTIWWIVLHLTNASVLQNQIFSASYGIVALVGGIYGFFISQKWGGTKSIMGKAILMFSLGLFAQEFGQVIYSIYNFAFHDVPYPSIGDIGYFGSIPCYITALFFLSRVCGVRFGVKTITSKIYAILIPLAVLVVGYILFLRGYMFDWTHPLTIFLDFGYPLGEAIYISLAILVFLLSRGILGGVMKGKVLFILFALCVQFASDYTFLYFSRTGNIAPGGFNDYMYLIAYFLMALGLIQLKFVADKLTKT